MFTKSPTQAQTLAANHNNNTNSHASLQVSDEHRFSLLHLRQLHKQLVENIVVTDENENLVVEILRIIAEMVVYGDNKSELLFDFFCEKNMLASFLQLMYNGNTHSNTSGNSNGKIGGSSTANSNGNSKNNTNSDSNSNNNNTNTNKSCPITVHIQILQTLSILINCVKNDTSLYYLLSNNRINDIIEYPHNFTDENLCDQFASFIKSLSLRLNMQTVQFFFIEETGSFPLMLKAIELLISDEQMVKISAQTTILNILRVNNRRARMYSLQENILTKLFLYINKLMINQYNNILLASKEFFKYGNSIMEGNTTRKMENALIDLLASTEDWFYYVQDLFELKIPKLSQTLISSMMSNFFYPVLLQPLATRPTSVDRNESTELIRRSTWDKNSDSQRSSHSSQNAAESVQDCSAIVSMVYLVQMLRVIVEPCFQRAAMTALFHPLNQLNRAYITEQLMQQELYNHANNVRRDFLSSIGSMKNYEQQNYQPNLYRNAVENLITPDNQKLATLGMYLLHLLTENIIKNSGNVVDATDGRASILDDANAGYFQRLDEEETDSLGNIIKESAANAAAMALLARGLSENEKMILMQCYFFLPNEGPALELSGILKNYGPDAGETNADSNVANEQEIDIQMDQDNAEALAGGVDPNSRGINDRVDENAKKDASHDPILNSFISENLSVDASFEAGLPQRVKNRFLIKEDQTINVKIAFQPDSLSFEAAKKVDFVTRKVAKELIPKTSMYQKCVMILVNADKLTAVTIQVASQLLYSYSCLLNDAVLSSSSGDKPKASGLGSSISYNPSPEIMLEIMLGEVRDAGRKTACSLLNVIEGNHKDIILHLVVDEMKRFENRKWKTCIQKMYKEILLLMPSTPYVMERMGIDFDIPVSQVEIIRKHIQTFLLIRALVKQLIKFTLMTYKKQIDTDLAAGINDQEFLLLDEANLGANAPKVGERFQMKGKRFLDIKLLPSDSELAADELKSENTSTPPPSSSMSILSLSASILTMGYLGSSPTSSTYSTPSSISSDSPIRYSSKRSIISSASETAKRASNGVDRMEQYQNQYGQSPVRIPNSLMFVQDPCFVQLVTQEKEKKSDGFRVFLAAPILYSDALGDTENKNIFRLFVRSWRKVVPNMIRMGISEDIIGLDGKIHRSNSIASNKTTILDNGAQKRVAETYLKPHENSSIWELKVRMESEQACTLAIQHIETKRKQIYNEKLLRFKKILINWASDNPMISKDD